MLSYPSGMTVSTRELIMLTDALRHRRTQLRTRWRRLDPGEQALLVVAYLRKGETYADPACGFGIGTSTVYRYLREALDLLAAMAPTLEQAIEVARAKAFVILDAPCYASTGSAWPTAAIGPSTRASTSATGSTCR